MDITSFKPCNNTNYSLHNNLLSRVSTPRRQEQVPNILSKEITPNTSCANQKSTGRCWIFAALNMLRRKVILNKKVGNGFEFSQSYVFFYDKLERMYYNLNLMKQFKQENRLVNDRLVQHLLKEPFGDGGQWVMFSNVANKYGLVPKDAYPESTHSSNSAGVNMVLSRLFRTCVKDIYNQPDNTDNFIDATMQKTYELLIRFFGEPPKTFSWNYKENDKVQTYNGTPQNFMTEFCEINFDDYVSLTHDPRNRYDTLYGVEHLGNVVNGETVKYLNLEMNRLNNITKCALDDNTPVWFGSDVGQFFNSKCGLLDSKSFDYINFLEIQDTMNKKDRIEFCESLMTHAMCYVGYNNDKYGHINYWKIENSWGTDGPYKGNLICSNEWFNEYTYQLIVPKKYLTQNELTVWEGEVTELFPLWDPMGSLA